MIQAAQGAFDFEIKADIGVGNRQAGREEAQGLVQRPRDHFRIKASHPQGAEGIVACKELITSIAAEGNSDMAARKTAQQPCRQERAVTLGLVQQIEDAWHDLQGGIEAERVGVMLCLEIIGNACGERRFVETRLLEANREGLRLCTLHFAGGKSGDRRGIQPPAEKDAKGNIRHQAATGRTGENLQ